MPAGAPILPGGPAGSPSPTTPGALADGWQRLHKVTPLLRGWKVIAVVLAIISQQSAEALIGAAETPALPEAGALAIALSVAAFAVFAAVVSGWAVLSWRMTRYRVIDGVLQYNHGVLFRQQRQTRLDRLQAVDVVQPLLGRIFGLSELRLEVAGGPGSDVKLAYLRDHEADRLRNALLAQAAGVSYEGDEAPAAPEQHLVDVPPGLLLGSLLLSTFTVWVVVALIGVTVIGIIEPGALLGMVPMLIGGASAVWARFARSFGFRVAFSADGLRLRHGLLETRTQTVPPGRVQAVLMYQPLLWRLRDWWALRINVAGYAVLGQEDGKAPQTVLVPVASRSDALLLLAQILPDLGHPQPLRLLDEGLVGMAGHGPADFTAAPRQARWLDPISWRRHGVAVTPRALLMRSGRLTRRLVLVPHERTQSLGLQQGWLQRRFGVATLVAHSTPGPVTPKVEHLAAMTAARLLDEQATRARAARAVEGPERWMRRTGSPPAG